MDDASAFFDIVLSKYIAKKGERECVVRSWRNEKKHLTIALSAMAVGQMLPPCSFSGEKLTKLSAI